MTHAIILLEHSEDKASKTPGIDLERQVAQVAQFLEAVRQSLVRCQHRVVRVARSVQQHHGTSEREEISTC